MFLISLDSNCIVCKRETSLIDYLNKLSCYFKFGILRLFF